MTDHQPHADYPSRNGASDRAWSQSFLRLVVVGYILAVAMPPIGFVLGLVVVSRGARAKSRHGALIIAVSVVAAVAWAVIIASGAFDTPQTDF
jgi:4-amino-4-deoxy-L-arabinose transferase-like glycosyltransferase